MTKDGVEASAKLIAVLMEIIAREAAERGEVWSLEDQTAFAQSATISMTGTRLCNGADPVETPPNWECDMHQFTKRPNH